jgi:hypothetical protein
VHPVQLLLAVLALYTAVGVLFAIPFAFRGVTAIDANARAGAPPGFRLLIVPGAAALWPLLLKRWLAARRAAAQARDAAEPHP